MLFRSCLEAIRLLTNLETEKSKLLQVVLFGQPELDRQLAQPAARQLLQRITFSHCLAPKKFPLRQPREHPNKGNNRRPLLLSGPLKSLP